MLDETSSKLESALPVECDVDEDDIGPQLLCSPQRIRRCQGDADDLQALPLEQDARSAEKRLVVIDDQDAKRHTIILHPDATRRIAASRNTQPPPELVPR